MQSSPLRSSVIGSYPFPSWLEFASQHLAVFGHSDVSEIQDDAVIALVRKLIRRNVALYSVMVRKNTAVITTEPRHKRK